METKAIVTNTDRKVTALRKALDDTRREKREELRAQIGEARNYIAKVCDDEGSATLSARYMKAIHAVDKLNLRLEEIENFGANMLAAFDAEKQPTEANSRAVMRTPIVTPARLAHLIEQLRREISGNRAADCAFDCLMEMAKDDGDATKVYSAWREFLQNHAMGTNTPHVKRNGITVPQLAD